MQILFLLLLLKYPIPIKLAIKPNIFPIIIINSSLIKFLSYNYLLRILLIDLAIIYAKLTVTALPIILYLS